MAEAFHMGVLQYMGPAWMAWIVAGLVLNSLVSCKHHLPKLITDVMEYGKLRRRGSRRPTTFLSMLSVPKRWFTHFYVWGTFWIFSVTLAYFCSCFFTPPISIPYLDDIITMATGKFMSVHCSCASMQQEHTDVAVVLGMLSLQVARRLYERLFVSASSNAHMHFLHYILGMFFYPAAAFTALLHFQRMQEVPTIDEGIFQFLRWYHVVAFVLFLWASYHQHVCHHILAEIRKERRERRESQIGGDGYGQPDGDWFELVSCPHFLAEIIIYAAMLLCFVITDPWSIWWLLVVYVVSTLGLSARQAHIYYLQKYEDYPKNRYAIIPWIC